MRKILSQCIIPFIFIYFIFTLALLVFNDYSKSPLMPVAPLFYGLCFFIIYKKRPRAFESISVIILLMMIFLRMVVVPVVYILSGYVSTIERSVGVENLNEAVLLVCWELFWTTLLILSSKKITELYYYELDSEIDGDTKINLFVKLFVLFLVIIGIICVVLDSSVLASVTTIFEKFTSTTEMNIERRRALIAAKNSSSLVYNLFLQDVFYLQILIPGCFMAYVTNKRNDKKPNRGYAIGLIVAAAATFFTTDNNMDSVYIMLACMLVMFSAYKKKISRILPIIGITIVVFIGSFLFAKVGYRSNSELAMSDLSSTLCAYFSAFPNVSCGFSVQYYDKLAAIWGDIVAGVPYMMVFFRGFPQSVVLFNIEAHGNTGVTNQIMPLISYGYKYFNIFAPLFTVIVYKIAFSLECMYRKTDNSFNKVLFALMFLNLSVGPCVLGFPSILKRLCYYVPMLILVRINTAYYKTNKGKTLIKEID